MINFWKDLPRPFVCLAPMEGVSDVCFRELLVELGKPAVCFTEFTNVEFIVRKFSSSQAIKKADEVERLRFTQRQRPIVAQVWGNDLEGYRLAAKLVIELGFDGIDINMGCPDRSVVKKGAGAALIGENEKVRQIIEAVREGVENKIPVSIKTRIGRNKIITEEWCEFLLSLKPQALTIHLRTARELSGVPARWEEINKVVKIRDKVSPMTAVIGNGDVESMAEARVKANDYGVDGVMIGRAAWRAPWMFGKNGAIVSKKEKLKIMNQHIELMREFGLVNGVERIKKYVKAYVSGFKGAAQMREKLMLVHDIEQMGKIIEEHNG